MNGTKLQVVIMDGQMEMTWDGETVYNGFSEAAAVWKFREELVDA